MATLPGLPLSNLKRKVDDYRGTLNTAKVDLECLDVWKAAVDRPEDSFIGVFHIPTVTFYLLPCFGYKADEKLGDDIQCFPANWEDNAKTTSYKVLVAKYAKNILFIQVQQKREFDGKSHPAMLDWLKTNRRLSSIRSEYLGWAIQRAAQGYILRFASGMNYEYEKKDQEPRRFVLMNSSNPKGDPKQKKMRDVAPILGGLQRRYPIESRDLPSSWALWMEDFLATKLSLQLHKPERVAAGQSRWEWVATRDGVSRARRFSRQQPTF